MIEKSPTFTQHDDGTITVDEWRTPILIAREFLDAPLDPLLITKNVDLITFTVANGRAVYRLTGRVSREEWSRRDEFEAVLVESEVK